MKEDMIKKAVRDAWDIYAYGIVKDMEKKNADSRSKIKSMAEGLRQFEDPDAAALHFIKYIEYTLPRSELNKTLAQVLDKISAMRNEGLGGKDLLERLQYTIGYLSWTMDAVHKLKDDENGLRKMLATEFSMIGIEDEVDRYFREINSAKIGGRR